MSNNSSLKPIAARFLEISGSTDTARVQSNSPEILSIVGKTSTERSD